MRYETKIVCHGEWLGEVPEDWDYDEWHEKHLSCKKSDYDRTVATFKDLLNEYKAGKTICFCNSGGFSHKVLKVGLYDGGVFWKPRPCIRYVGPIPGEHVAGFYDVRSFRVES